MYTMHTATSTVGNQVYSSVGLKFNVNSEISVFELGIYDSGSDGIISVPGAGTTLSTVIFDSTQTLLAQMDFTTADPGTFDPTSNYLFKPLATPLVMAPGEYTIVGYGFNALNKEHNAAISGSGTGPIFDDGGSLISFVVSLYGGGADVPSTYPTHTFSNDIFSGSNMNYESHATPVPGAVLLGILGLSVAGVKLRKFS
jgi:hypothetical protein